VIVDDVDEYVAAPFSVTLHTVPLARSLSVNTAAKVPPAAVNVIATDAGTVPDPWPGDTV
jgi:hypothetical protein